MVHRIATTAGLMGFWLLLSGHYTSLLIGLGVFSCILVTWLVGRMGLIDRDSVPLHLVLRAFSYLPWFALEVIKSNLHVTRVILFGTPQVKASWVRFQGHEKTDLGRFIYANSITLTPGTITTGVYGDRFEVHALTQEAIDGTEEGEMDRRVVRLEA